MTQSMLLADYFIIDREGAIRLLSDSFVERVKVDNNLAYEIALGGHQGYDSYTNEDIINEIEDFNLIDRALEEGVMETEDAI